MAGTQDFLWINKTIHSSALSNNNGNAAARRSINKHVQRRRSINKQVQQRRTSPSLTGNPSLALGNDDLIVVAWRLDKLSKQTKSHKNFLTPAHEKHVRSGLAPPSRIPPSWGSPVDPHAASDFHRRRSINQVSQPKALQPTTCQNNSMTDEVPVLRTFKGNSDPFGVFPVPINPETARLLSFTRTAALPGIFMSNFYRLLSGATKSEPSHDTPETALISYKASQRFWQANIQGLADNCYTLAWLATWAGMLARASPTSWAGKSSLSLRLQAVSALRQKFLNHFQGDAILSECFHTICGIFNAECLADDVPAARIHGAVLRRILESGHYDYQAVIQMVFDDVDLAVRHNHRTFLNMEGWCIATISPHLTQLARKLLLPPIQESSLHPAVTYPPLRSIWLWYRQMFEIMKGGPYWNTQWAQHNLQDTAYIYFTVTSMTNHGRLHNMYLDLTEGKLMQYASSGETLTQAALVLMLIYVAGRIGVEVVINNVDIRDASEKLTSRLWDCLEVAFMVSSEEGRVVHFADAYLWLAYIGALEEVGCTQRRDHGEHSPTTGTRFRELLRTLCEQREVQTWMQMKKVAERFLHATFVEPDGEEWFEDLLLEKLT